MKQLNKTIRLAAVAMTLLLTQTASATPSNITDTYIGGEDHGYGDVIGSHKNFDISSMDVERVDNLLSVSINTGFAGKGDDGLYDGTNQVNLTKGKGIGYGDLFLSSSWTPYGSAPYLDDNNHSGTVWRYGFSLDDRWMNESQIGAGTLYRLNSADNDADTLLSQDFLTNGHFRTGQEIAVDTVDGDVTVVYGNNHWNISSGQVNFLIDLAGTSLANSNTIALHWGMSCGNDVIEGQYQNAYTVPEPTIISLLLAGIAGIWFTKRRHKHISFK